MIGTLDFYHGKEKLRLNKKDQEKISIFCGQVAGVIQNFSLLEKVEVESQKSEKLLLNILPKDVATELKEKGFAEPTFFEQVSVMFTDFKGFTQIAEKLSPQDLIKDLDACFVQFDKIIERYNLEKLKTIGDSYMCAGGIPKINISGITYNLVKDFFDCEYRGKVNAKNKSELEMYYVNGLKKEFSKNGDSRTPNHKFWKKFG